MKATHHDQFKYNDPGQESLPTQTQNPEMINNASKKKNTKNIRQGNQENANLKYASLLRLVSPRYAKTIPSKTELEHNEWKTLV